MVDILKKTKLGQCPAQALIYVLGKGSSCPSDTATTQITNNDAIMAQLAVLMKTEGENEPLNIVIYIQNYHARKQWKSSLLFIPWWGLGYLLASDLADDGVLQVAYADLCFVLLPAVSCGQEHYCIFSDLFGRVVQVFNGEVQSGDGDGVGPRGQAIIIDHFADHGQTGRQLFAGEFGLVLGQSHRAPLHSIKKRRDHECKCLISRSLNFRVIVGHFLDDFPADLIKVILQIARLGDGLALSIDPEHFLQDTEANKRDLEVGLLDAEFYHADQALDQSSIFVFLLALRQDAVETLQIVLPVLREELLDGVLAVMLLHEGRLLDELSLHLLSRGQLFGLFLALLIRLGFDPIAPQGRNNSLVVVLSDFSDLCPGLDGSGVAHFVGDFGVGQTAEVVPLWLHELVAVLVLRWLCELIFFLLGRTRRALLLGLIFQNLLDFAFDEADLLLYAFGSIEVFPLDRPCDHRPMFPQLHSKVGYLSHGILIVLRKVKIFLLDSLLLLRAQFGHIPTYKLLILFIDSFLHVFRGRWLLHDHIGLFRPIDPKEVQPDLREEVLLGGVRLMKQKPKVEAVDIHHDNLFLSGLVLHLREIEKAVLIKSLFLRPRRHVVEDIDLGCDLPLVGMELQLPHIDHSVKLEGYLLRVRAESAGLPPGGAAEEQRTHGVVLLLGTAGDYFEFQLATHKLQYCWGLIMKGRVSEWTRVEIVRMR